MLYSDVLLETVQLVFARTDIAMADVVKALSNEIFLRFPGHVV